MKLALAGWQAMDHIYFPIHVLSTKEVLRWSIAFVVVTQSLHHSNVMFRRSRRLVKERETKQINPRVPARRPNDPIYYTSGTSILQVDFFQVLC